MNKSARAIFPIFCLFTYSYCAKVLGVFPTPTHSHFTVGFALMKELAERGHDVTMISPYPQKTPIKNFRDIDISSVTKEFDKTIVAHLEHCEKMYLTQSVAFYYSLGPIVANGTFSHQNVRNLLNSKEEFDVVVVELFYSESMLYFAHHFKAPLLVISPNGASIFVNHYTRNPTPYSHVSNIFFPIGPRMTFMQRIHNLIISVYNDMLSTFISWPAHDGILHQHFPNAPSLKELMKKVSVILINSHSSFSEPFPLTPNMIEIGGYHVKPTGKLPKDIQEYLDNATEGVIYFCLGSNLKPSKFSKDKIDLFVKALAKLKLKVLWKFESKTLPNKPKNVKLIKWAPQQDILAHKNVKVFIAHGGLLGIIEAIYFGVPILGIPFFADQPLNVEIAVSKGYAIGLPIGELTEQKMVASINELLTNSKYSKKAAELSLAMRDRSVKPIDEAVYWVEYMMRHPNATYFKSAATELNWIQYHMLDVVFVVLITLFIIKIVYVKVTTVAVKRKYD